MFMGELLVGVLTELLGELFGDQLDQVLDKRALQKQLTAAVERAEQCFIAEHSRYDAELVDVLANQTRFADLPTVQFALRELLTHPFHDPHNRVATVKKSFDDVLPSMDRSRVDAAVATFLQCIGQEVLYIPQLWGLYELYFQKGTFESNRKIASGVDKLVFGINELNTSFKQLTTSSYPELPGSSNHPSKRQRPYHNLPRRSYSQFFGRDKELEQLTKLMLPYPRSRYPLIVIDGIGGVGKTALAQELAYRYRDNYETIPDGDRFDAIVWVSAKRTLLTAHGIQRRQQTFNTLDDLYRAVATVLNVPEILRAEPHERRGLVEQALTGQRVLLVIDNLETVTDEELLSFLREVPDPTKVLITTRHRIDVAYVIRLTGISESEAIALISVEASDKKVELTSNFASDLYRRTGGIPAAIVWSIALMSVGHGTEVVLRRLGSGRSDIARFCFTESVSTIRDRDAYKLLLALSLFDASVNETMLGEVAGLGVDVYGRDEGLGDLRQLSLVNQEGDRYNLLPLTRTFAQDELAQHSEVDEILHHQWIIYLTTFARQYTGLHFRRPSRGLLRQEGQHLVTLANWCQQADRLDVLMRILPALTEYYDLVGQWGDILNIGKIGLDYARLTGDLNSIVLIETYALAWIVSQQGRHQEAERYLRDALRVSKEMGDITWQCEVLIRYSQMLRRCDRFDQAYDRCQEAIKLLPLVTESDREFVRAYIEYELGKLARDQGQLEAAKEHLLAARDVFRYNEDDPASNLELAWGVLGSLGVVEHKLGNLNDAAEMYLQCLDLYKEAGGMGYVATLLVRLATLEEQRQNLPQALVYASQAVEMSRKMTLVEELEEAEAICTRLKHAP